MGDFCEVTDVAALLQVDITDPDKLTSCGRAIKEASAAIRNYTGQNIEKVEDEVVTLDVWESRRQKIALPELPVISVGSVVEDGETLTAGSDEDYVLINHGQLYRVGAYWATGAQVLVVTYTHGYATIPDDVAAICTRAAARVYQAGLLSAENEAVLGVSSKGIGDYSVQFGAEQGGGMGEGRMGVSGSRLLLLSEKDVLNKYRI